MPSHGIPRIQTLRLPSSLKELSKTWSFLLLLLCTLFNPYRSCPAPLHLFFLSLLIDKSISMHLRLPLIYLYCYCYYYLDQTQLAEFRSYEGQDMLYTGDKIVPIKVFLSFFLSFLHRVLFAVLLFYLILVACYNMEGFCFVSSISAWSSRE